MNKEQFEQIKVKLDQLEKNLTNDVELDWTEFEQGLRKLFSEMNGDELEDMRDEITQIRDRVAKLQSVISIQVESLRKQIKELINNKKAHTAYAKSSKVKSNKSAKAVSNG